MKHYEVVYGNAAWVETYRVWARNIREARRDFESELRRGVQIIKIIKL